MKIIDIESLAVIYQKNKHLSCKSCVVLMSLILPDVDDDDSPDLFAGCPTPVAPTPRVAKPKAKPTKTILKPAAKPRSKGAKKRPASASASTAGVSGFALPEDDDGGTTVTMGCDVEPQSQPDLPIDALEQPQYLAYDDPTLKIAASKIPSVLNHPFRDLDAVMDSPQPCEPELVDSLWEIYSVPRMGPIMRNLGGRSRRSYDLKMFWDLREPSYQRCILQDLAILQPKSVVLSPPCTYVCQLMHSNWNRMDPKKRTINLNEACGHIDFSMWIAGYQDDKSRYFAFEHPQLSLAWDRDSVAWFMFVSSILF